MSKTVIFSTVFGWWSGPGGHGPYGPPGSSTGVGGGGGDRVVEGARGILEATSGNQATT